MSHLLRWSAGLARAETQTSEAERECLAKHARGKQRLAEIGVWHGVTTRLLRSVMSPTGVLFAIDPFPVGSLGFSPQRVIARREVSGCDNGQVVWLRTTGSAAAEMSDIRTAPVDFVFIDGDHSYEGLRGDWLVWRDRVAMGGAIALHDSRPTNTNNIDDAGSVKYTRDVILNDRRFNVIDAVDTLTILRRIKRS